MSTTGEAANLDGSSQPATSNSAVVSNLSSPDMACCSECQLCPAEFFCLSCKEGLCARCDKNVVHISKVTRSHPRMKIDEYLMVERGLGHFSPTDDQMYADDKNKFWFFSPIDHRIHLQPRLASLVPDPNAQPSLAAFIGPTGVGKSSLLRLLVSLDGEADAGDMPLAGAPNDAQSTSADIHIYAGGQVRTHSRAAQSAVDSTYPLLYVDSEGFGGSTDPRAIQSMWKMIEKFFPGEPRKYEDFHKRRFDHVQTSYPRMLYIFSDVLCFVFSGDWREQESIVKPLVDWGQKAAVGAANQHRPQLILIFNKTGAEAKETEFDDFRKTYIKWIKGDNNGRRVELQLYYSDPLVCLIPQMDINAATVLRRVTKLRQEIHECTERIRSFRKKANQLFTRRQLQLHMQLAADTFSKDPPEEIDIYTACMARRPISVGLAGYIAEFRRAVEQANSQSVSKSERHQISLSVLQNRIKLSVLLLGGRLIMNLPVGKDARLPERLRTDLEQAQTEIDGEQPCAAEIGSGHLLRHCDTVRRMHASAPHAFVQSGKAVRWDGDFIAYPNVQRAADRSRLVDLAERALQSARSLDVKKIRKQLSELRQSERHKYPWLKSFTFYRVCVSCMVELPTEVLSCGHIICAICAKEVADLRSPKLYIDLTCPDCLSSAKWYPKGLPPLAGYRILSLDGGGVRGIVELLSLEKIMSFFPGMHVEDLFDIIVGTSTGGIIALALTVHALHEQRKCLPEVIQLFENFCRQVFSSKMLRTGARYDFILRVFQILRIYDTKYKNDNLLKLLKEHFGEQPLLRSCVGGPHVIVTSCDRDNNLAGAWFTSYNRPMLENECDDLFLQAHREETEQQNRKLLFGRVPNNHLFSAKDVAAATSAAGTYFPAYEAGNQWWVDGGLRFNGPAAIAIQEARTMWPEQQASALISLGCGELLYDEESQQSESLIRFIKRVVNVVTDSETQCYAAMEHLKQLQPDSSGCSLRLNPIIKVPKGKNCELDQAKKIPFLRDATTTYLDNDGRARIQEAANLLFAALFYLDVEIDQDSQEPKLDRLRIRSRAALPQSLIDALKTASCSSSPPFSVTVFYAPGADSKFSWAKCTWNQNVMNLPFELLGLPMARRLDVAVKLHMCLPGTTAPKKWPLSISGMPWRLGVAKWSNANG